MLSVNPVNTPIKTPTPQETAGSVAFKGAKKPSAKELRKFKQLLDEQVFIAKMKNPLISKAEKEVYSINYATQKLIETPTMKKVGMYIKAFGQMCLDGVKSVFKK